MSNAKDALVFHCSQPIITEDGLPIYGPNGKLMKGAPTHTLAFEKYDDNTIIIGWAKAHANDNYNKKAGRELAIERINATKNRINNFPDRPILQLTSVSDDFLPTAILQNNFNYYFTNAVSKMVDLDANDSVKIYFRTTSEHNTVCSYEVLTEDIIDAIEDENNNRITREKLIAEVNTQDFIFAIYNQNDKVYAVVQNHNEFYANGYSITAKESLKHKLIDIIEETGMSLVKNDEVILIDESLDTVEMIRTLCAAGLSYDFNLEAQFVK